MIWYYIWYYMIWYIIYDMILYIILYYILYYIIWYYIIWSDSIWYDMIWYYIWYDMIYNIIWLLNVIYRVNDGAPLDDRSSNLRPAPPPSCGARRHRRPACQSRPGPAPSRPGPAPCPQRTAVIKIKQPIKKLNKAPFYFNAIRLLKD